MQRDIFNSELFKRMSDDCVFVQVVACCGVSCTSLLLKEIIIKC